MQFNLFSKPDALPDAPAPRRRAKQSPLPLFGADKARLIAAMASWFLFTGTDLFCGASGVTTGFEKAQVEGRRIMVTRQGVNHDLMAIASSKANYSTINYLKEDITKLDANLLVRTSILWASLECFPTDTLILTSTGLRPIQDLAVGDMVLTHKGRWRAVTATMHKDNAPTYIVRGQGHPGLTTTEEHPFYVRRQTRTWNQARRLYDYKTMSEPEWATVRELAANTKGIKKRWRWATPTTMDRLPGAERLPGGIPPIGPREISTNNPEFWWLIGRWLGDGSILGRNGELQGLEISAGNYEADALFEKLVAYWDVPGAGPRCNNMLRWKRRQMRTAQLLYACHSDLAKWVVAHFGRYSHGKRLPSWVYSMPEHHRKALLAGYLSADGHQAVERTQATTVSKELAVGLRMLAEGLGHRTSLHRYDARPETSIIEGRQVNVREIWVVAFDNEKSARGAFADETHAWSLGKGVAATGKLETVYNISVEEDESYVVEGIVVHNCTNFSNAKGGQSRDADSRSLAEHMERYIRAVGPMYFMVENVREFMSWGPLKHKKDKAGRLLYRTVGVMEQRRHKRTGELLFSKKTEKPLMRQVVNAEGQLAWEEQPVMVPESRTKGIYFLRWKQSIEDLGYVCHHKLLDAADYGERTSRRRLFMIFAKKGLPVRWPEATHSKGGKTPGTLCWEPVRPCLNLDQKGESIFTRAKPLVEKTLRRIFAGLCRYIAGSDVPTVTRLLAELAAGNMGGLQEFRPLQELVTPARAAVPADPKEGAGQKQGELWSGGDCLTNPGSLGGTAAGERPGNPIVAGPDKVLPSPEQPVATGAEGFVQKYYGTGENVTGFEDPSGSLTCKDRMGLVQTVQNDHHVAVQPEQWVMSTNFEGITRSLEESGPTLTAGRRHPYLAEALPWLLDNKFDNVGRGVDGAGPTLLTGDHHYLMQAEGEAEPAPVATPIHWEAQPGDSPTMGLIRQFMRVYGLSDVLMRMLMVQELLRIQGFPENYVLLGSSTDQKKFVGNSVPPKMSQRLVESLYEALREDGLLHLLADYAGGLDVDAHRMGLPLDEMMIAA